MSELLPRALTTLVLALSLAAGVGCSAEARAARAEKKADQYYDQGRFREAAEAYEEAARLRPGNPIAHRNAGDAYERLGDATRARRSWQRAVDVSEQELRVNPNDAQSLSRLAVYEAKLGRRAQASRHILDAVRLSPGDGDVAYRKAVVHALAGEREAAVGALAQAVARGYSAGRARVDYDLRSLGPLPEFQALVAQAR